MLVLDSLDFALQRKNTERRGGRRKHGACFSPASQSMEYQASSVALSQKLSNGHSIYDGVFSSPASKFKVSAFSSRVEDYTEIFGGSGASRGSSIPVLEVPELHERKASVDVRSSKLDYSNVFSGFGDSDFGVPYEELFAESKKRGTRYIYSH